MAFNEKYFSTHTYKDVSFAKYSQYWWSNRFYAILARRYGQRGTNLLEIGSGLGHLVGQLEGTFKTAAVDVNHWALTQSGPVAPRTPMQVASAEELPFKDAYFGVVIIKHVVEHLPHPEKAIAELGRVLAPGGILILATPNLDSLLKPWKGDRWIGYQDPTHIALKPPAEWLELIRGVQLQAAAHLCGWLLGCALYFSYSEEFAEIIFRFPGRIPGNSWACPSCQCDGGRVSWWLPEKKTADEHNR